MGDEGPGAGAARSEGLHWEPMILPSASPAGVALSLAAAAAYALPAAAALPVYVRDKVALTTAERLASGGKA